MYFLTNRLKHLAYLLLLTVVSGCFSSDCDDSANPGIELVLKNITGDLIVDGVTVVITDDDYSETLTVDTDFSGAYERPGNYSLLITGDQYEPYVKNNIIVWDGDCHVKTVRLSITLNNK